MNAAEPGGTGRTPEDGEAAGTAHAGKELSGLGEEMFPLLGFLLVSARNLYDEPPNYVLAG